MKKIILITISLFFLVILTLLVRTGKERGFVFSLKENSFIEGIRIVQRNNNGVAWTLTASKADFVGNEEEARLEDVNISIEKNGVVLYAKSGVYNLKEKSFITDSVVNANSKDFKITADSIDYNVSNGMVKTDGKVKVSGKNFEIEGKGMRTDENQKVTLERDVTATFNK